MKSLALTLAVLFGTVGIAFAANDQGTEKEIVAVDTVEEIEEAPADSNKSAE